VKVDVAQLTGGNPPNPPPADSTLTLSALEASLLSGDVSQQTHDSIRAQIDGTRIDAAMNGAPQKQDDKAAARKPVGTPHSADVNTIAGWLLGSPEFQRR
jgi:hypothetical protein